MHKDYFTTGLLALIAISLVVGLWSQFVGGVPQLPEAQKKDYFSERVKRMVGFEIVGKKGKEVVNYTYRGEKLPPRLDPREVVGMRTENSYTVYLGDLNKPQQNSYDLELRSFSKQAYTKAGDDWYFVEYGQTSKENFDAVMKKERPLSWLWGETAYAVDYFAGAGDGYIYATGGSTWSAVRDATTGTADPTSTIAQYGAVNFYLKADSFAVYRVFLPFDTSSIPASATITAASISVYGTSTPNNTLGGTWAVVRTSQATHTTLANTDFPNIGTTLGSSATSYSGTIDSYITVTLNATGIGWIAKSGVSSNCSGTSGISCFGLRDNTYDIGNVTPCTGLSCSEYAYISTSEADGTSQDPYLSVTYSTSFAPWLFWEF